MAAAAGTRVAAPQTSAPLGPASNKLNQAKKDMSVLRPGITTTVTGMRQAIHALETGTGEVRNYLLNEINLIYECKVCHNMFRSLANLIAHKRSFCKQQYRQVKHVYEDPDNTKSCDLETVFIEAEPVETVIPPEEWDVENYAPSLELLKDAGILEDIQSRPVVNRLLPPKKQGINAVVASLRAKVGNKEASYYENQYREITARKSEAEAGTLELEPINETGSGLFQTWKVNDGEAPTTGQYYRVIQEKQAPISVAVGPNGMELPRGIPPGMERTGPVSPGSEGSKENHADGEEKIKFQCPTCRKSFSNIKTVLKHLVKAHNQTMDQAKLLKKQIKNSAVSAKGSTPKEECKLFCIKCWAKFKTPEEFKSHCNPRTCLWLPKPSDPFFEDFQGIPSPIERIHAYVRVKKLSIYGNTKVDDLVEQVNDSSSLFDSRRSSLSSTDDTKSLEQMHAHRNIVEKEELLPLKVESEMNRRHLMNKRKIQCNVCYDKKFKSTLLLKRHVAEVHMELGRWSCTICDFRIWTKEECLRHASTNHRLRGNDTGVTEIPFDVYFKEYLERREKEEKLETEQSMAKEVNSIVHAACDGAGDKEPELMGIILDETLVDSESIGDCSSSKVANCNGDDEVSIIEDTVGNEELRKRKRSSSDESFNASEYSSAKQSRSGTVSPVIDDTSKAPSKTITGRVISSLSSFMGSLAPGGGSDSNSPSVPNLDEDQNENQKLMATTEPSSSDLKGSPQKSNGV